MATITSPDVQRTQQTSPIFRIRGQKSYSYPDRRLSPEFCQVLEDMNIDERGEVVRRAGYTAYPAAAISGSVGVTGIVQHTFTDGTTRLVEVAGTLVNTNDGTAHTDVTGTAEVTDNDDYRIRYAIANNQIFVTQGPSGPRPWLIGQSGNAAILASSIAFATASGDHVRDFAVHRNYLFAIGTKENGTVFPTRIRWCNANARTFVLDTTVWPSDKIFELYDEGPAIVGGTDNFGTLLVFKADGLYPCRLDYDAVGGYTRFRVLEGGVYRGFEPVARGSIVSRPEFTWVVARDGAYIVTQASSDTFKVEMVTDAIRQEWNDLNQARIQYAQSWAVAKDHQIHTLLSSSGNASGHDRILIYDWESGDVWFNTPAAVLNCGASVRVSSTEYDFFGDLAGFVYQGTGSKDNATGIDWRVLMTPNDLGMPAKTKLIHDFTTYYRTIAGGPQTINLAVHRDQGILPERRKTHSFGTSYKWDAGLKYDSGILWPGGALRKAKFLVNRHCLTFAPEWTGTDDVNLVGYSVGFSTLE